jgi:tryptophan synthase beta chain
MDEPGSSWTPIWPALTGQGGAAERRRWRARRRALRWDARPHSISAGLDYPGIGPELAWLHDQGRISFACARDDAVVEAVDLLARTEGILPALESAHAVAHIIDLAPRLGRDEVVVINISGRGDKDLFILADAFADQEFYAFLRTETARHGQQD